MSTARPAFYALAPGGWRDYVTLLHPPYTLWHLSYVCIGAALAPEFRWDILGLALLAFFLGMGVAAHALDETHGRPLGTEIGKGTLYVLAAVSLLAATAIGIVTALFTTPWLLAFVAAGAFITVAYNLELFSGRFHGDLWFAVGWGALPLLATYVAAAETIRVEAVVGALFAALLSYAQRQLSTPVRLLRRRVDRRLWTDGARGRGDAPDHARDADRGARARIADTHVLRDRPRGCARAAARNLTPWSCCRSSRSLFVVCALIATASLLAASFDRAPQQRAPAAASLLGDRCRRRVGCLRTATERKHGSGCRRDHARVRGRAGSRAHPRARSRVTPDRRAARTRPGAAELAGRARSGRAERRARANARARTR